MLLLPGLRVSKTGCGLTSNESFEDLLKLFKGSLSEGLHAFRLLKQPENTPLELLYLLLKSCIRKEDLADGRSLYTLLVSCGFDSSTFLGTHLIRMFASCDSLSDANLVFGKVHHPSVFTWTAIISAHVRLGETDWAFRLYHHLLQQSSVQPNEYLFVAILRACLSLTEGNLIHNHVIKHCFCSDIYVANTLISLYIKCGSLSDARIVFDNLPHHDVVSWNLMIGGYIQCGQSKEAFELFQLMQYGGGSARPDVVTWNTLLAVCLWDGHLQKGLEVFQEMEKRGVEANESTYAILLKACASLKALDVGLSIHIIIVASGHMLGIVVANTLIDMYAKCGRVMDAHNVFDRVPNGGTMVTWNAMIAALAQHGSFHESLQIFHSMYQQYFIFDDVSLVNVLKACSDGGLLEDGKRIHTYIILSGLESTMHVCNTLVDMYCKCGHMDYARRIFDRMQKRDRVTWNAIIMGCALHGHGEHAFKLFQQMEQSGVEPNNVTFVAILKTCSTVGALACGRFVHARIVECNFEDEVVMGNILIHMYAKCKSLKDAQVMFDKLPKQDVVTWSAMIAGYAEHGDGLEALLLYQQMQQSGLEPNHVLYVNVLKACLTLASSDHGKVIHGHIFNNTSDHGKVIHGHIFNNTSVFDSHVANTLISFYSKCGNVRDAQRVFDDLPTQSIVSWNAMIAGYARLGDDQKARHLLEEMNRKGIEREVATWNALLLGDTECRCGQAALQTFEQMQHEGIKPDDTTFVMAIKSCASVAALHHGKLIHDHVIKSVCEMNTFVGSSLIDLYAKCGDLKDAHKVFDTLPKQDVVPWNAIIAGCAAQRNSCKLAVQYFQDMQRKGVNPDGATFVCLLSVCSHAGLAHVGCLYFDLMRLEHNVMPSLDHFNCLVDVLGRTGFLIEAEDLLHSMPMKPDIVGWSCLLCHCQSHQSLEVGRRCFDYLLTLDTTRATDYVLLSSIYADSGEWEDAEKVQDLRKNALACRRPGKAFIEVQETMHDFLVGDRSHSQSCEIYARLRSSSVQMREKGYVPNLDLMSQLQAV